MVLLQTIKNFIIIATKEFLNSEGPVYQYIARKLFSASKLKVRPKINMKNKKTSRKTDIYFNIYLFYIFCIISIIINNKN